MAKIVARTWEWDGEEWNQVLDHVFYGRTLTEAEHIMQSHSKTDAFFRGCAGYHGGVGRFREIVCYTEITRYG